MILGLKGLNGIKAILFLSFGSVINKLHRLEVLREMKDKHSQKRPTSFKQFSCYFVSSGQHMSGLLRLIMILATLSNDLKPSAMRVAKSLDGRLKSISLQQKNHSTKEFFSRRNDMKIG